MQTKAFPLPLDRAPWPRAADKLYLICRAWEAEGKGERVGEFLSGVRTSRAARERRGVRWKRWR